MLPKNRHLLHGYLAAIATLLMWSGFSLVSRLGGKSDLTPYDTFALRLGFATLALFPFVRGLPTGIWRDTRMWCLTGFCSLIYCPLAYNGFKLAPAAHAGILLAGMQPFLISAIIWLCFKERPGRLRAIGLILISTGMLSAAVPYFSDWSADTALGDLLISLSSISWALYSVFATRWGYSAWTLTRVIVFASSIVYLPIYFLCLPKNLAEVPLSITLFQGVYHGLIATIVAMLTYLKAVSILGTERAAAILALVPIVIGILAVPLLDEPLTGWLLSGLVFVSLGSYIASRFGTNPNRS